MTVTNCWKPRRKVQAFADFSSVRHGHGQTTPPAQSRADLKLLDSLIDSFR